MSTNGNFLIAIESAIGGGSISLFSDNFHIDGVVGATAVARAEDLLPTLDQILTRNGLKFADISQLVVSSGPGSFTGIRIGLSTAMGLAASCGVQLRRVSALKAIALEQATANEFAVVLPVGRDVACIQRFSRSGDRLIELSGPEPVEISRLGDLAGTGTSLMIHPSIVNSIDAVNYTSLSLIDPDISGYLGRSVIIHGIDETPEPLFIGKQK